MTEILVHWHAGRSQGEIAASLGVDGKTVKKYVSRRWRRGWFPVGSQAQWAGLVRGWFPELVDTRLRPTTWLEIDKHRELCALAWHQARSSRVAAGTA